MNYTDIAFVVFFVITFALYYTLQSIRGQLSVLVAASLIFYSWTAPPLLIIFLCSWFITGLSSFKVLSAHDQDTAKTYAWIGVVVNLSLLAFFKYKFLFISPLESGKYEASNGVVGWLILAPLPIGISFYTFHGISLLVDIYRGKTPIFTGRYPTLQTHLSETLLYLVFFPQLIAGPIIKAKDFYPQVGVKRYRDVDFAACFRILVLGYFLKAVVADNLSEQTFWIAYPFFQWRSSGDLLVLLYGYSAQIFADFAGYSLIAIGLAKLLGYNLPANFNFPYISTSVSDFWRRWHISLSSWLRDYLYVPLGGSRKGEIRTYFNLMIVMFLGGLWHGAAWSFAVWGLWHGIGLVLERPLLETRLYTSEGKVLKIIRALIIFNFVTIGWLFFKLQDFSQAALYIRALIQADSGGYGAISASAAFIVFSYGSVVFLYHIGSVFKHRLSVNVLNVSYGVMLFLIATNRGPSTPFIYFQF